HDHRCIHGQRYQGNACKIADKGMPPSRHMRLVVLAQFCSLLKAHALEAATVPINMAASGVNRSHLAPVSFARDPFIPILIIQPEKRKENLCRYSYLVRIR